MADPSRAHNFAYTQQADPGTHDDAYQRLVAAGQIRYLAYSKEVGSKTNKEHEQGFLVFEHAKTLRAASKLLPKAHLEIMRKPLLANERYCSKDGALTEFGEKPQPGQRKDLDNEAERIRTGETTVEAIRDDRPQVYHQFGRTLTAIQDGRNERTHRTWRTEVIFYMGADWTTVWDHLVSEPYVKSPDNEWWDGYEGQEDVIIAPYTGERKQLAFKRLGGNYPCKVPRKGRPDAPFLARRVFVGIPDEHNVRLQADFHEAYC